MKHISLFSGIGGFDLASEWMGWENIAHCEWNPFGQKILKYYWPEAISYEDITKTDFSEHRGKIDIVTGGFPCQPYSVAGKRKGKDDERHLWPEMLRAIREIRPRWVVGENVRGLVNWDGGLVFEEVQADLESQGYKILPFLLPASGVGAPHQRERIWFVAYSDSFRLDGSQREHEKYPSERGVDALGNAIQSIADGATPHPESFRGRKGIGAEINANRRETEQHISEGPEVWNWNPAISRAGISSDTDSTMREGRKSWRQTEEGTKSVEQQSRGRDKLHRTDWEKFPSQSPICLGNDGISARLDGITFSKWRKESIKAGGNAIVPQVAYQIFKAIQEYDLLNTQIPT